MKIVVGVFLALALYGFCTAHIGAGLVSLFCAGFFRWAFKSMESRSGITPICPKSTEEALDDYCCECCGSDSPV